MIRKAPQSILAKHISIPGQSPIEIPVSQEALKINTAIDEIISVMIPVATSAIIENMIASLEDGQAII